ncbi:MAG: NAD(P)/FAD-dependent oxidoreductase [Chitinophagales bacterium]
MITNSAKKLHDSANIHYDVETDILIIGAGPVGLFTVFEAGLVKLRCHLIDTLPMPGGQLTEIYPKKPIYDIPGFPEILAGDLVTNLMKQIEPFKPGFTLGERAEKIEKQNDGRFVVTSNKGTVHLASVVAIAGGLGCFEPRKPPIANIEDFEDKGVAYIIKNPEIYAGKKLLIAGGGDSALDWTIYLSNIAKEVTMVHRRTEFRGAPDSVEKIKDLAESGKINLITNAEVVNLHGNGHLQSASIRKTDDSILTQDVDFFIPLFGLSPQLGPIADWGLNISKNAIDVDTFDYSTNVQEFTPLAILIIIRANSNLFCVVFTKLR